VIIAIIQARMGSSRFPGKTLADLAGRPMLSRVVERVSQSRAIDKVVVATSIEVGDDPIAEFCAKEGVLCFRGSEDDVLDRRIDAGALGAIDLGRERRLIDALRQRREFQRLGPDARHQQNRSLIHVFVEIASRREHPPIPRLVDMRGAEAYGVKRGHDFRRLFVDGSEPPPLLEVLHHDEQPLLPAAARRRLDRGVEDLRDKLVGDRVGTELS